PPQPQPAHTARRRAAHPSVLAGLGDRELFDGLALYDRGARQDAWGVAPAEAREALQAPNRIAAVRLPDGGWALAIAPKQSSSGSELVAVGSLAPPVPPLPGRPPHDATPPAPPRPRTP